MKYSKSAAALFLLSAVGVHCASAGDDSALLTRCNCPLNCMRLEAHLGELQLIAVPGDGSEKSRYVASILLAHRFNDTAALERIKADLANARELTQGELSDISSLLVTNQPNLSNRVGKADKRSSPKVEPDGRNTTQPRIREGATGEPVPEDGPSGELAFDSAPQGDSPFDLSRRIVIFAAATGD